MALTDAAFRQAEARMQEHRRGPIALAAHYDAASDRVRVELSTGIELGFAPAIIQGLDGATPTMALNPDRLALVRIYDSLPATLRQGLVQVASSIQQLNEIQPLNP